MKIGKKIGLGIVITFLIVIVSLVVWQWNNLKALYIGIAYSNEKIEEKINATKEKLAKELAKEGIVDKKIINGFSKEDEEKLKKGEISVEEAVGKIFESESVADDEMVSKDADDKNSHDSSKSEDSKTIETGANGSLETNAATTSKDVTKPANGNVTNNNVSKNTEKSVAGEDKGASATSSKEVLEAAIKEMYSLKARFVQRLATIELNAKLEYIKGEMNRDNKLKIADMFMPQFTEAEKECDTQVEIVLGNLKSDLEKIGADTSIIKHIREQYNNEKELQKSKYISEYL